MGTARALAAGAVALGVVAFVPARDHVGPPEFSSIRVMTWNVRGSAGPDPDALAAEIVRRDVDVAGLQEIEREQTRALEAALREGDSRWRAVWHDTGHDPGGAIPFTSPPEGHAILSRFGLTRTRSWRLPQRDFHERILQRAVVTAGDTEIYVYNTHLCRTPAFAFVDRACWAHGQTGRTDQARALLRRMHRDAGANALLLGDLNARPDSRPIALLGMKMEDAGPEAASQTRIDYVFVRGLAVGRVFRPPSDLSDHLPVIADVGLR